MTASTPRSACAVRSAVVHHGDAAAAGADDDEAGGGERGDRRRSTTEIGSGEATTRRQPLLAAVLPDLAEGDEPLAPPRAGGTGRPAWSGPRSPGRRRRPGAGDQRRRCAAAARGRPGPASSSSARVKPIVAWVCATFQSSGTGGTTCAAISFLTSRLPTWGPLPWVSTTSAPAATTSATWPAGLARSRRAARPASPSRPARSSRCRRGRSPRDGRVTSRDPSGRLLSGEVPVARPRWSAAPEVEPVPPGRKPAASTMSTARSNFADRRRADGRRCRS